MQTKRHYVVAKQRNQNHSNNIHYKPRPHHLVQLNVTTCKTIAFGGVPIGIMLAQLAARVIANPSIKGFAPIASEIPAITGEKNNHLGNITHQLTDKIDISATITINTNPPFPPKPAIHFQDFL
jgi:hypothetical protein